MTPPRYQIYIVILLCVSAVMTGCRPKGILHSGEMRRLLLDLHKTDAWLQVSGNLRGGDSIKSLYYAQVLEKHGVTQAEFDSSLVWYTAHPQLFDKIYPKVLADLTREEESFLAAHEKELNPQSDHLRPVGAASEAVHKHLSREELDSTLWVMQYGVSTPWGGYEPNALSYRPVPSIDQRPWRTGY